MTVAAFFDRRCTIQLMLATSASSRQSGDTIPAGRVAIAPCGVGIAPRHGTSRKLLSATHLPHMNFAF